MECAYSLTDDAVVDVIATFDDVVGHGVEDDVPHAVRFEASSVSLR